MFIGGEIIPNQLHGPCVTFTFAFYDEFRLGPIFFFPPLLVFFFGQPGK